MKSWRTKSAYEIFQVLSGRSNAYYIATEKCNILVDTGKSSAFQALTKNIEFLKRSGKPIDFLILTHTHFDHCQNAARIRKQYSCKIIISENEESYAEDGYTPVPQGTTPVSKLIYKMGVKVAEKRFRYEPFTPDIVIAEYFDFQECDLDIKIIKTEGHSSGSVSILLDDEIAIVGDTMFGVYSNSVFPPFADKQAELIKSWHKLLGTDCQTFLPGHGKEIERKLLQKEYDKFK